MRAMILAAGRGERMRPLTATLPKPMLLVAGKPLIQHHVERLVNAGIREIVINHAVLGEQIEAHLGDGRAFGASLGYSPEGNSPLETGGGILQALPLLGDQPFIAINADIWTDFPLQELPAQLKAQAHIILVDNPAHNRDGDFALAGDRVLNTGRSRYTFAGIGVYRPELFAACRPGAFPLAPVLRQAADRDQVTGRHYPGFWSDIGTPERLSTIRSLQEK